MLARQAFLLPEPLLAALFTFCDGLFQDKVLTFLLLRCWYLNSGPTP
jgi:hypothetical protein